MRTTLLLCLATVLLSCSSGDDGLPEIPTATVAIATAAAVATHGPTELNPAAESNARVVRYMIDAPGTDPDIAGWLNTQAWISDGTQSSIDLVAAIINMAKVDGASRDALQLLETLSEQPWYSDGFDDRERLAIRVAMEATSDVVAYWGAAEGFHLKLLNWTAAAFERGLASEVQLEDGRRLLLTVVHSGEYETEAGLVVAMTQTYASAIENYAGEFDMPGLFVAIDSSVGPCGIALGFRIVLLNSACINRHVVVHELIHVAGPGSDMTWFAEGIAYFGAEALVGLEAIEGLFDIEKTGSSSHIAAARAGYVFFNEWAAIVGLETVREFIKSTRDLAEYVTLRERVLELTPRERRGDVERLIDSYWRVF